MAAPQTSNAWPGSTNRPLLIMAPAAMQNTAQNPNFRFSLIVQGTLCGWSNVLTAVRRGPRGHPLAAVPP